MTGLGPLLVAHLPLVVHAPLLDDPLQVITDPAAWVASWLWPAIFGKDAVGSPDWAASLFSHAFFFTGLDASQCTGPGTGTCSSFSIWSALQTTGYLVLAMAMMLRMVRTMAERKAGAGWNLLLEIPLRGVLGVAAINVSYAALALLMHSSIVVGGTVFDTIMSVTTAGANGESGLTHAIAGILSPADLPIPLILETLSLLYLTALLLASRVAIIFAIAVAPLVIPLYAYNSNNSVLVWWLRLVAQGLLVPIVMGALFAVALVLIQAVNGVQGGAMAVLLGTLTAVVSMWFVGHSITHLLRHLFPEHRSFLANAATFQSRTGFVRNQVATVTRPVTSLVRRGS
jgi:hypothetical protein